MPHEAEACGCTSPPVPSVSDTTYAVNQQSEQIIFEVEEGYVTARVLIRYSGDPAQFAWIVPVPSLPELEISESLTFGLLDEVTSPSVSVLAKSVCPGAFYQCMVHPAPQGCISPSGSTSSDATTATTTSDATSTTAGTGGGTGPDGVDILSHEQIGSYDTYVFSAGDAAAAVAWLQSEGFIVNDTMSPFMQPYADAGMLFVASKLIPGAGVDEIRPLKMRYMASQPMIPLRLTAVAAEPHLTVTTYIFGQTLFEPVDQPLITVSPDMIDSAADLAGNPARRNYPMALARAIDEAGGDAFVWEYAAKPPKPSFMAESCCYSASDSCSLEDDGACQCPNQAFDAQDCAAIPGIVEATAEVLDLASKHAFMTRVTTRLSPEEMTFDPAFQPSNAATLNGLTLEGTRNTLVGCEGDVIDPSLYQAIKDRRPCSAVYCGEGECVLTAEGAACDCDAGKVARVFVDLDAVRSVTCVPSTPLVDYGFGGLTLPSACNGVDCGLGQCVDVGGFPACQCDDGAAARRSPNALYPVCEAIVDGTGDPGGTNYTGAVKDIPVCAPAPPDCGTFGWLVPASPAIAGEHCASSEPDPSALEVPPKPTCEDYGLITPDDGVGGNAQSDNGEASGCDCEAHAGTSWTGGALLTAILAMFATRRRRSK